MIMGEYLDARLPVQDWSLEAATNPIVSAFVFIDQIPSTYAMNCAQKLEEFGFFGAVQIVKGTSQKLGSLQKFYPLETKVEIRESAARLSIDGLAMNVQASNLSEPFRSIRALEAVFYLPDGICSQEERCFKFVTSKVKED